MRTPNKNLIRATFAITIYLLLPQGVSQLSAAEMDPSRLTSWEKVVEAANAEGQVTIYTGAIPALIINEGVFQKRYPGIKVVTAIGKSGADAAQRIMAERRAQKHVADLVMGTSSSVWTLHSIKALEPIKPALLLPEVVNESNWWGGSHHYVDTERRYIFTFMGSPRGGSVFYNTNLVKRGEINSYWDFLDPKWRGKIEARDLRDSGTAPPSVRFLYHHPNLGPNYLKRLFSEMEITLFRDRRVSVDWLATGKFAICLLCLPTEITKAKKQNLPIDTFDLLKEGAWLDSLTGNIGLVGQAPHRNAALVFLNWLLSREGQITSQSVHAKAEVGVSNSLRTDIPKDIVPADERPIQGTSYLQVDSAERISSQPILQIFKDAFSDRAK